MKLLLPAIPPTLTSTLMGTYLGRLVQNLQQAFTSVVADNQAVKRIILLSDNGTSYDVTVTDGGVLVVTQNPGRGPGGTPP